MKNTKSDRKPLRLNVETLLVLQSNELERVAGGEGADEAAFLPTKGCRTIIGSFNGNCCNTKFA